jgi:hypothetical protein
VRQVLALLLRLPRRRQRALRPRKVGRRQPDGLARARRRGDNAGMARDDTRAQWQRVALMLTLDGSRPSGTLEWVPRVAPVVTQAVIGAGHWTAGRRQRAVAAWASAAGFGLLAWGLGTEAPTQAEVESIRRQQRDRLLTLNPKAAADGTRALTARQQSWFGLAGAGIGMVTGVRSGLRHPQRRTALAIAGEAPTAVFSVLRVARAVQLRRPRIAAGSALVVAGSIARLRAASAEPLR